MKIVELDGYTLNPGDLSWAPLVQLTTLRAIGVLATGYNVVDVEAARERLLGIVIGNIQAFLSGTPRNVVNA